MRYTQGQWIKAGLLVTAGKIVIADCRQTDNLNEMDSNANLIAAAPDLYEALDELFSAFEQWTGSYTGTSLEPLRKKVSKALAKAEGK